MRVRYKVEVIADLVGYFKVQTGRRAKIEQKTAKEIGLTEGEEFVELVDYDKELLILVRKDRFGKLLKDGLIQIVNWRG